ncbi:MAG: hypothetical protein AB7P99_05130 [Vicinamibacterales bacterium]
MFARLLLGGIAWLAALLALGALLQWAGTAPPRVTSGMAGVDRLSRALNDARLLSKHPARDRWTVAKSAGFLTEMVVEVIAERPGEDALEIARQIVLPVQDKYREILIYVHAVDSEADPAVRRVDWTPQTGFTELTIE